MVVQNAEKAAAFYRDQFGSRPRSSPDRDSRRQPGRSRRSSSNSGSDRPRRDVLANHGIQRRRPQRLYSADSRSRRGGLGLQVHDMDAAIAAIKAAGGSSVTQGGNVKLGNGKVGFVRDPNGLLVELAQN